MRTFIIKDKNEIFYKKAESEEQIIHEVLKEKNIRDYNLAVISSDFNKEAYAFDRMTSNELAHIIIKKY